MRPGGHYMRTPKHCMRTLLPYLSKNFLRTLNRPRSKPGDKAEYQQQQQQMDIDEANTTDWKDWCRAGLIIWS
jgi:hypothetical protein